VHDNITGVSLERACTYDDAAHKTHASISGTHGAIYSDEDRATSIDSSTDESLDEQGKTSSEADENDKELSEIHTPLEFQIPAELLHVAMTAPENTKASFWSSNLYRGPGDKRLSVHYCKTKEVAERVAQHFVNEKVLGFDIEWKPWSSPLSIKKNVSLIQLACEDRIALFHIALFSGTTAAQLMPPTLKAILESPDVYKVGVAVKGDFSRITKYLEVEPQGVFELSRLNNLVQWHATDPSRVSNKLVGLSTQVQQHLQLPLYKGGRLIDDPEDLSNVRSSDWSLQLNLQQIHYAAADAYAGFRLYDALEEKRKQLRPTPPRPLVCDYDSKSVPRSPKPRKKPKATKAAEGEVAAATVEAETSIPTERREEVEEAGGNSEQMQEAEGYETAQEEMIDSHQLESDMLESSEGSRSEMSESEEDSSTESTQSMSKVEESAVGLDVSRKRVGRVNLNRLKGRDPGYPSLSHVRDGEEGRTSSDRDCADDVDSFGEEGSSRSDGITQASEVDLETGMDKFDDSELEEALQDLNIDSDGRLQRDTTVLAEPDLVLPPDHESSVSETTTESGHVQVEDIETFHQSVPTLSKPKDNESADSPTADHIAHEEEQRLIELLDDPEIVEYLHLPLALDNTPSSSSPHPTDASHTPEFELATSWAQTYLQSTIPSPTSRVPSHIRATIPHLRAYNMWHHQELSLAEIAGHLRDPPLSESTVGSYVLQAISLERMEYDKEEVRKVLMAMPEALRKGKWRGLAEKVGAK
jgi:hypothetical protein